MSCHNWYGFSHKTFCFAPTDELFTFYWKWVIWFLLAIKYFHYPGFGTVFIWYGLGAKKWFRPTTTFYQICYIGAIPASITLEMIELREMTDVI